MDAQVDGHGLDSGTSIKIENAQNNLLSSTTNMVSTTSLIIDQTRHG